MSVIKVKARQESRAIGIEDREFRLDITVSPRSYF